jgi:hypothetical protein
MFNISTSRSVVMEVLIGCDGSTLIVILCGAFLCCGGSVYNNIAMQISVGKMSFDYKKQKGVLDKSFVPVKIPLHKDSSCDEVLRKCIDRVSRFPLLEL